MKRVVFVAVDVLKKLVVVVAVVHNLLFECPIYALLRSRHIPDSVNENDYQKYLVRVLNDESQENILNLVTFLFYALKLRPLHS